MPLYRIEHVTRYVYKSPVATSQHAAWLEPRAVAGQVTHDFALTIDPQPKRMRTRTDYFGNRVHQFDLPRPHSEMEVTSRGVVSVDRPAPADGAAPQPSWEELHRRLRHPTSDAEREAAEFTFESPQIVIDPAVIAFARSVFVPGRTILDGAEAMMHRIHSEFTFDAEATTPTTPVSRVLSDRRGVCQDFAHLQIACLRSLGLAARYVSGYLLTDPPPGMPRLIGADASHAWVSVFSPVDGWVDLDPTNGVRVGNRHVTVAWGRDYSDVTPLRGVLLGGDEHTLVVGVSVIPVGEEPTAAPTRG